MEKNNTIYIMEEYKEENPIKTALKEADSFIDTYEDILSNIENSKKILLYLIGVSILVEVSILFFLMQKHQYSLLPLEIILVIFTIYFVKYYQKTNGKVEIIKKRLKNFKESIKGFKIRSKDSTINIDLYNEIRVKISKIKSNLAETILNNVGISKDFLTNSLIKNRTGCLIEDNPQIYNYINLKSRKILDIVKGFFKKNIKISIVNRRDKVRKKIVYGSSIEDNEKNKKIDIISDLFKNRIQENKIENENSPANNIKSIKGIEELGNKQLILATENLIEHRNIQPILEQKIVLDDTKLIKNDDFRVLQNKEVIDSSKQVLNQIKSELELNALSLKIEILENDEKLSKNKNEIKEIENLASNLKNKEKSNSNDDRTEEVKENEESDEIVSYKKSNLDTDIKIAYDDLSKTKKEKRIENNFETPNEEVKESPLARRLREKREKDEVTTKSEKHENKNNKTSHVKKLEDSGSSVRKLELS